VNTALAAVLLGAAALLPVRSVQQLAYVASFGLAGFAFWLWGRALARRLLGDVPLGPFTAVYLGELAALAVASVATAAIGLGASALGRSLPLVVPVSAGTLLLLRGELAARARRGTGANPALDLLTPFGAGCIAVVVAIYARHLSPMGLDTHEHIAWVEQILRRGHVPLAEPGTRLLGDYPRTFHLLTALWAAAGLAPPSGPFVKAMPFLQTALPLLALGELLVAAWARRAGEAARPAAQVAVAAAFFLFVFTLVPAVYPWFDLSGTPRISSNALLLLPVVLVLLAAVERSPGAAALAVAAWPLLGAWALTWNPIVAVLLLAVGFPGLALFWAALRPPLGAAGLRQAARWLVVASALAMVVAAQDPWAVSEVASRCPRCATALRRMTDLVPFDEAVRAGLATAREKSVRNAPAQPPCADLACAGRLAAGAVREALELPLRAVRAGWDDARALAARPDTRTTQRAFRGALPLQPNALADHAALPYLVLVWGGAAVALAGALRGRRRQAPAPDGSPSTGRLLAVSLATVLAAGVLLQVAAGLAGAFDDHTHERVILDGYLHAAGHHVSLALLGVPFLFAFAALAEPLVRRTARAAPLPRALRAGALAAWIALPLAARLNLEQPWGHHGFGSHVELPDVLALRRLERLVPPEDGVLVPAEHVNVARWEHWVLPVGPTAALLPYGERRYLFDVYLGASYPLSWRDLEDRFCSPEPARRRAFLARERARWLLVRDQAGHPPEVVLAGAGPCGAPLAALGAELPPVAVERGIHLFRLRDR
jgi:hypothetical protein